MIERLEALSPAKLPYQLEHLFAIELDHLTAVTTDHMVVRRVPERVFVVGVLLSVDHLSDNPRLNQQRQRAVDRSLPHPDGLLAHR